MRSRERGHLLLLVLMLLSAGSLLIMPGLNIATTGLTWKQIRTDTLMEQYCRDAGAEFAIWQLMYGGADVLLDEEGEEAGYTVYCDGMEAEVVIRMKAELGQSGVPGAEDNRIRVTKTVVCDQDGDGFDDDCSSLPPRQAMRARYTIYLDQVSPDTSVGLAAVYDELPKGFTLIPGFVTSPDGSFPEITDITTTMEDIQPGGNEIWKWEFSSPIYFQQGEVKQFTFLAHINKNKDRYCNQVFLKLEEPPNERSAKVAPIAVGANPPEACDDAGAQAFKYVNRLVAPPNETTVFTYIINVSSIDQNTLQISSIKDVLPQGPFIYCSPDSPPPPNNPPLFCDPPMYKEADDPFDPATGDFTDTTGFTTLDEPVQTYLAGDERWELSFDGPGGAGWNLAGAGQAGDNLIFRLQAHVTPTLSGSYYNEFFVDVSCSAPQALITEGVTTQKDYCASYSWPSGGTIVPTYDVKSTTGDTTGQGNISLDWGAGSPVGQLISWHIN